MTSTRRTARALPPLGRRAGAPRLVPGTLATGTVTALAVLVMGAGPVSAAAPAPAAPPVPPTGAGEAAPQPPYDDDTVLVRFRSVVTEPGQERVAAGVGVELGDDVGASGWTRVDTGGRDPEVVRAELARDPAVAVAELDPVRTAFAAPDDPLLGRQGAVAALRLPAAWDVTTGSSSTVIAVLDTGVDPRHPDLEGRVLPGTDVVNRDADASDDNGHGTGVAGAAAASAGNRIGIAGVDWKARVLPVKVLGAGGEGRDSDIAEGIRWAVDNGATVVNLSLGGVDRSAVLADAVAYALGRGAVVVAAAGNTGRLEPSYPAAYPGVIAVTATNDAGLPAPFSTHGDWVDVSAPGVKVATLGLSSRSPYVAMTGTSFASPLVAGVAGLVRAAHPDWDPIRVHDWLRSTARDVDVPGFDPRTGTGMVDASAAVRSAPTAASTTAIHARYAALGGARSVLGDPVGPELATPDDAGRYRHYRGGSIYWTSRTGAHEVYGSIRERWARLGWERSPLGYPVTGELPAPDGTGRYVLFEGGSVYWSPRTGAHEVRGAIRDRWAALRWEAGPLRYPTTGQLPTPDGGGRYNHFLGGSIYWSPRTGAHAVYGAIRDRWAALGWEQGTLGYPTSSEYDVPGGRASDFERGRITWDRASGRVTVTPR